MADTDARKGDLFYPYAHAANGNRTGRRPAATVEVMRWAAPRAVASGLAIVLLAGCTALGGIRRSPPSPPGPTVSAAAFELRIATAPVPSDYRRATVDFSDSEHGAALYVRCSAPTGGHNECLGRLVVTKDGGRSWHGAGDPEPAAENQQLYVARDGTIVLLAEPRGWYVSRDYGRTFRTEPYGRLPVAYRTLEGPYEICCAGDAVPQLRRFVGERPVPVATRPPLPGTLVAVAYRPSWDLWVASLDAGRPHTAYSRDEGRTWTVTPVPEPDGGLRSVRLQSSTDQLDIWLVGDSDRTTFPAVWWLDASGWERPALSGTPPTYAASAAVGGGALAVTGPAGTGLVTRSGQYVDTDWPVGGWLRTLADGTLLVTDDRHGKVWLGVGGPSERRWVELVLENP